MRQIATISLALVPLLSACSTSTLGPILAHETEPTRSETEIRKELRRLRHRVSRLNRRLAAATHAPAPAPSAASEQEMAQFKERLAELEARSLAAAPVPAPDTDNLERKVASLSARLAELSQKLEQRERDASSSASQATTTGSFSAASEARLAALEDVQKKMSGNLANVQADREKDRALVSDYLEELDKRIADLEKAVGPKTP